MIRAIAFVLFLVGFWLVCLVIAPALWLHLTLSVILAIVGSNKYWVNCFLAYDQFLNTCCSGFLNWIFGRPNYKFGWPDETVSSVLGKNIKQYPNDTHKSIFIIDGWLTKIDGRDYESHSVGSIEEDENHS